MRVCCDGHPILSLITNTLSVVSMIDGRLFDKLEHLARMVRQNSLPFGGIQLVVCGDFFQLPPVPESLSTGQKIPIKFAFEADSWDQAIPNIVMLNKVFRQKEPGESHCLALSGRVRASLTRLMLCHNRPHRYVEYDAGRGNRSSRHGSFQAYRKGNKIR